MEKNTDEKRIAKRRSVTFLIVLGAIGVFCAAALLLAEPIGNLIASAVGKDTAEEEKQPSYHFFEGEYADWEIETWQELNRYIAYSVGGEMMELNEDSLRYFGPEAEIFISFFDAITAGDADTYAALFTDHYYESSERIASFGRQLAYDIEVTYLSETTENGVRSVRFRVGYKLYHNNGMLRTDVGSGACRPQIFTVTETPAGYRIDSISAIRSK